jgi:hypothetical protein
VNVSAIGEYCLRSNQYPRTYNHGALEYKSANVKQACAFPADQQIRFASLLVASLMRKQREELWAPHPPEYRKLLRARLWRQDGSQWGMAARHGVPRQAAWKTVCALRLPVMRHAMAHRAQRLRAEWQAEGASFAGGSTAHLGTRAPYGG